MVMDYNKIIQNEIDESYKTGKKDGFEIAYNIVSSLKEQYRNSKNTTESELDVFYNLDMKLKYYREHNN